MSLEQIPEVMNDRDVAKMLGLSEIAGWKTVQRLARQGVLRGRLVSHKQGWRFHRQAVVEYLINRRPQ